QVIETKLDIVLDRRAPWTVADRKEQFDAAMKAHALFGEMSDLVDRIDAARKSAQGPLAGKLDALKMKIVATKEGGAITGEERIREHLDLLYGALQSWEGRPARYQVERIATLERELDDVRKEANALLVKEVPGIDEELKKHKLEPIPTRESAEADEGDGDGEVLAAMRGCLHGGKCDLETAMGRETDRR
ncbi:MAG: hypothetical protein ACXVAN_03580, partial [Polyangia bacterium]